MSTYVVHLKEPFPYAIIVNEDQVVGYVAKLVASRDGADNGSSFAVTSDSEPGTRKIWLSETSAKTLGDNQLDGKS